MAGGIWFIIVLLDLFLCGIVYGFDGLHCYNGMVVYYLFPLPERLIPMGYYLMVAFIFSFFGILSLCFITLCISAYCRSNFHAVVISAVCYGAPVLAAMFVNLYGIARILYAAPVFMVIYRIVEDIYSVWIMLVGISIVVSLVCVITAYLKYKG